jgi:hypothetical protein
MHNWLFSLLILKIPFLARFPYKDEAGSKIVLLSENYLTAAGQAQKIK